MFAPGAIGRPPTQASIKSPVFSVKPSARNGVLIAAWALQLSDWAKANPVNTASIPRAPMDLRKDGIILLTFGIQARQPREWRRVEIANTNRTESINYLKLLNQAGEHARRPFGHSATI